MIYFDNAATSFPKPAAVIEAVREYMLNIGANPGRSGHRLAIAAGKIVFDTRFRLAQLFGLRDPMRVIFTLNATDALNLAVKGLCRKGDHIITTGMEHNSTIRPLHGLRNNKIIDLTIVPCDNFGYVDPAAIAACFNSRTRAVVLNHASNVNGIIQDITAIGKLCREQGIILIADCAQSAGTLPLDLNRDNIDLAAVAGHKGLLGPTGTGALLLSDNFDHTRVTPWKQGGTGSRSDSIEQPDFLPDAWESGTLNVAGIAGWQAGISFLESQQLNTGQVLTRKTEMQHYFQEKSRQEIPGFICYSPSQQPVTGVVAFRLENRSVSDVAQELSDTFNIMCRPGLHCAPLAHRTLHTFPEGTLRFGFSLFNTYEEIDLAIVALQKIAGTHR